MNPTDWLSIFEFGGGFAVFIGFCLWQLRQLDKLDEEDELRESRDAD